MAGPDIVAEIKARILRGTFDFSTAEGRAAFDADLRREIMEIGDESLRFHAAELLKAWRWSLVNDRGWTLTMRVEAIEKHLGLAPPKNREREVLSMDDFRRGYDAY